MIEAHYGWIAGRRRVRRLAIAIVAGGLAACSGVEPMRYTPIDEIPPGPGLFSGEDGVFTLYRSGAATEDDGESAEP